MTATKTLRGMFSTQGMLHQATIHATCVATGQRNCKTSCKKIALCNSGLREEGRQITTLQTDIIFLENERCLSDEDKFLELYLQQTEKYIIVRSGEGNFGEIEQLLWNLSRFSQGPLSLKPSAFCLQLILS